MELDFDNAMTFEKAHLVASAEAGLDSDATLIVSWEVALGLAEDAKKTEKARRITVLDPVVDFKKFEGTWRSVSVSIEYPKDRSFAYIIHKFAKGYARTLSLEEARLIDFTSLSGSGGSAPVSDGGSDSPQLYLTVYWQNLDNHYITSLSAPAIDGAVIEEQTIGTGYHLVVTSTKRADDGSGTLTAVYAQPQMTLSGFRDYLGERQTSVHYLHQVPQALAQSILDSWKTASGTAEGRTAIVSSYDSSKGLVDIVLYTVSGDAPNLSITGIKTHCDETVNIYMGWRYIEAQVNDFFSSHSGTGNQGETMEVDVKPRGDGFFDVIAKQTIINTSAESHVAKDTVRIGSHVDIEKQFAFKRTLAQLAQDIPDFDIDGISYDFKATRRDDCLWDYEIVKRVEELNKVEDSTEGNKFEPVTIKKGVSAKQAEITSLLTTPDQGWDRSANIEIRENGLFDYEIKNKHSTPYSLEDANRISSHLEKTSIEIKKNLASAPSAVPEQAEGTMVESEVVPHPNGLFDQIRKTIVSSARALWSWKTGTKLFVATESKGVNAKSNTFNDLSKTTPAESTTVQLVGRVNKDGTIDWEKKEEVSVAEDWTFKKGTKLKQITEEVGVNFKKTNAQSKASSFASVGNTIEFEEKTNKDGTVDYIKRSSLAVADNASVVFGINRDCVSITITREWWINQSALPSGGAPSSSNMEIEYSNVEQNPDGTWNYIKTTTVTTIGNGVSSGILIYSSSINERNEDKVYAGLRTTGVVSSILVYVRPVIEIVLYHRVRTVTKNTTRTFSLTPSGCGTASAGSTNGNGQINETIKIDNNLYAIDTTNITVSGWVPNTYYTDGIQYIYKLVDHYS